MDILQVYREIDKIDRLGPEKVKQKLLDAGMNDVDAELLLAFITGRCGPELEGMKNWFRLMKGTPE